MVMTAAPALEPVTLAEAKAQLRIEGSAEDAFISSLIVTSRVQIEAALGLALISQTWRLTLDDWPDGVIELSMRPVQSVHSIEVANGSGGATALAPAGYHVDGRALPPRIILAIDAPPAPEQSAEGIAITFTAGFGPLAADVPAPIRQALLLLVAHWFENREPCTGAASQRTPDAISTLLAPYRMVRL